MQDVHLVGNAYGGTISKVSTVLIGGGAGDDTFFATPGRVARQGDNPIAVVGVQYLTVDAGAGSNRLVVYLDDTNAPDTVWVTGNGIARDRAPFLLFYRSTGGTFGGGVAVVLGAGPETVVVQGQPTGVPLAVYGQGGDDTFYVGVTAQSGYANLTLDGGTGNDSLGVFDLSGGAVMRNVATLVGLGRIEVTYVGGATSEIGYQNLEQLLGDLATS
jgi:hypothetical protein